MKKIILLLIALLLGLSLIAQTPHCGFSEKYTTHERKWEQDTIRWRVDDSNFVGISKQEYYDALKYAFNSWAAVTELTFVRDSVDVDLLIRNIPIDGDGGVLGQATLPYGVSGISAYIEFDLENWRNYSFKSVALHEVGHTVGLLHSQVVEAVMYSFYSEAKIKLTQDDTEGANKLYNIKSNLIRCFYSCRSDTAKIEKNFTKGEFIAGSCGKEGGCFFVTTQLAQVLQLIRDYYGVPIVINSGARSKECNASVGGVKNSFHTADPCAAADISFSKMDLFINDILSGAPILPILLAHGVRGIGIYDTHIHIDLGERQIYNSFFGGYFFRIWQMRNNGLISGC